MVLESLLNPKKAEKKPWDLFFLGVVYATVAFLLSYWVFREYVSIVMVTLTAICSVPLIYNTILTEAKKDDLEKKEYWLIKEHGKAVTAFTFLFLGFVAAFLIWFTILPSNTVQDVFSVQIDTITQITTNTPTGNLVVEFGKLSGVLMNNLKILIFCFILSFFFGAGAIFILTWNASVVAAAIGTFIRNNILEHLSSGFASYFHVISLGVLKYMTHGVIEIIAYFIGGLAGGIISIAVIRHDFGTHEFKKALLASVDIVAVSLVLLFIAALIEVFVSPLIV
jgi:stage II sporulation protein M